LDEPVASLVDGGRPPDERDDLVERVERLEVAELDVRALLGLLEAEARAPDDDLDLVRDPVPDEGVEAQGARHAIDEREHVRAERVLQLGVLVKVVEDNLGHGVSLELDDEALARATRG